MQAQAPELLSEASYVETKRVRSVFAFNVHDTRDAQFKLSVLQSPIRKVSAVLRFLIILTISRLQLFLSLSIWWRWLSRI